MNTHEHLSIEILADYAEGLLGDADATSVAEQLASCADCQAEADLLVSVGQILAADDPGPMPAHFAARIDAALADLAAAEPVTPKTTQAPSAGAGATVIDLASRRRFTPAARVTSVAASLVLLIGGVALGMQAINTDSTGGGGDGAAPGATPTASSDSYRFLSYAVRAQDKPTGKNAKKGKNGAVIDRRSGTVFLKSGKVLFPDGVVVVPKKNGAAEVRTFDVSTGKSRSVATFRAEDTQTRPTSKPPASTTTPVATPTPTPDNTPKPPPPATVVPTTDPYVTNSGETYTEDNFAAKVQSLLGQAGETTPGSVSAQSVGDSSAPSPTQQNRVSSAAVRADADTAGRGPAPAEVAAKVKRCATQLDLAPLVAGDMGVWKGQSATILVVRNADAKQASGYVVYGDCTKDAPATKAGIQWTQAVNVPDQVKPTPEPSPTTNPAVNPTVSGSGSNNTTNASSNSVGDSLTPNVTTSLQQ